MNKTRILATIGAVAWMILIFRLSEIPGSNVPGTYGTLGHFVLYAVLGALYMLAAPERGRVWRTAALTIFLASLYGISDEFHQSFTPQRVPDVIDWLVDTAGAATAVLGILAIRHARTASTAEPDAKAGDQ